MNLSRRVNGVAVAVVSALVSAGCATMAIGSYAGRSVDFSQYRSYGWAASDRLSTGDPRLDNNPFFLRRLQASVDQRMENRGLEKRQTGPSDLVVHYHASVSQRLDIGGIDSEFGYCSRGECRPSVYEAGTIVLDFVDTRTNTLVWRGWAEGSFDGAIDDQDWMERRVDEAARRILERFPLTPRF